MTGEFSLTNPVPVGGRESHDHYPCACGAILRRPAGRGRPRKRCDACAQEAAKSVQKEQQRNKAERAKVLRRTMPKIAGGLPPSPGTELREITSQDGYFVGSDGHIYSTRQPGGPARLAQGINGDGYQTVQISRGPGHGGKSFTKVVHKLVAAAFLPPRPEGAHDLRHLDGDTLNNAPSNLAWGTQKDNADDRARHGRTARGERNAGAKLTEEQVKEIKRRLAAGERQAALSRAFKVPQPTMSCIARGKLWGWLEVSCG